MTAIEGTIPLTVGNTIEKELFDGGGSRNIDGGEDSPLIGDVTIQVKKPVYKLGGRDANLSQARDPARDINSHSQAA
jgi:hypothetical protein